MHVFSEISPTFEFFSFGHRPKFCVKFKNLHCQRLSTLFFAANLQFKFDSCAMVAMGASNVHKCTRVYPYTYTCTWVHLYGTFVRPFAGDMQMLDFVIIRLSIKFLSPSLCLSVSLHTNCTSHLSLQLLLWIPLYAHLTQHRPKCHKHTHGHTVGQPQSAPPLAYWLLRARA